MKLNIYEKKQIVKTYTADRYDLMLGTLEDVSNAVKLDDMKTGSKAEILGMTMNLVKNSYSTVIDLIKDVFDGITDEELRKTKVIEIVNVLADIVTYTVQQLNMGFGKN